MAEKAKRRWYQFSLRALLILLFVASLPLGAHVAWREYLIAKRLAEIEKSFQWLESLDYPDMPNGQPVMVKKIFRSDNGEAPYVHQLGLAFLLSEDAKSFTIVTPSLERETLEREKNLGEGCFIDSCFERISLRTAVEVSLTRKGDSLYDDPFAGFGDGLPERGQSLVMAWTCARQGYSEWAIKLYDAAEASTDWREFTEAKDLQELSSKSFLERAAAGFANCETRNAIAACGSDKPRAELLKKFRWIKEHFPNSKHVAIVLEKAAVLEQMVADDAAHEQRRAAGLPFEQLSKPEQIEELIFQLRDRSIDFYSCNPVRDPSAPYERLHTYGYEAIPQLAAALADKSLSRSLDRNFGAESSLEYRVWTVAEFADQLLIGVAGRGFHSGEPTWSHSGRLAALQNEKQVHAMQKAAVEWHGQLVTKGERACLIEAIREGGQHCGSLAWHLATKDPDAACAAILDASEKADDDLQATFSNILGRIHTDESLPYLFSQLEHDKVGNRRMAAEALVALRRAEGVASMIEQWQHRENSAELEWVGPFLVRSRYPEAIRAVARRFSEQPIEERASMMYEARSDANPKQQTSDELRAAMIELLLVALADTEMRPEHGGSWGGPSIEGLRICDMAGYHLNQLEPARFGFDIEAGLDQRERARGRILLAAQNRERLGAEEVSD